MVSLYNTKWGVHPFQIIFAAATICNAMMMSMETFATLLALGEGNTPVTGDLGHHHVNFDVTVMRQLIAISS